MDSRVKATYLYILEQALRTFTENDLEYIYRYATKDLERNHNHVVKVNPWK